MRLRYNSGTHNIRFKRFPYFKLQLQTPRWSFENYDYYVMFPTVVRLYNDADDGLGMGFAILGFGVGLYFRKEGL